jgi:hypothetical protein
MKPWSIRIVAFLFMILGVLGLVGLMIPSVRAEVLHLWAPLLRYAGILVVGVGLWRMFKWGFYAYAGWWVLQLFIFFTVYEGASGEASPWLAVLGPIIVCAAVLPHWSKLQ